MKLSAQIEPISPPQGTRRRIGNRRIEEGKVEPAANAVRRLGQVRKAG